MIIAKETKPLLGSIFCSVCSHRLPPTLSVICPLASINWHIQILTIKHCVTKSPINNILSYKEVFCSLFLVIRRYWYYKTFAQLAGKQIGHLGRGAGAQIFIHTWGTKFNWAGPALTYSIYMVYSQQHNITVNYLKKYLQTQTLN